MLSYHSGALYSMKKWQQIVLIWFVWSVLIIVYMQFSSNLIFSSRGVETTGEAEFYAQQPYLNEVFLNSQVAWDSEFYLSIATFGYDDPDVRLVYNETGDMSYSMSYAFFPFYPYLMKLVRLPLLPFLNPIAASTLAGVLISLLGTLAGMLALYDLGRDALGETVALRATILMLIFPSSYFFSVIYTEGLFIGLAFGSLALLRRKQWIAASLLAALATWTRSIGIALLFPLFLAWAINFYKSEEKKSLALRLPFLFAPLIAYSIWRYFFGEQFDFVQQYYFRNHLLNIGDTIDAWQFALSPEQYYPAGYFQLLLGLGAVILAFVTCLLNWRRFPYLSLFAFIAIFVPMTSGAAGTFSAIRFVLLAPGLWFSLAQWSESKVFRILWMLFSGALLALYAFLFAVDMWAG
jgi:hypothetical protein